MLAVIPPLVTTCASLRPLFSHLALLGGIVAQRDAKFEAADATQSDGGRALRAGLGTVREKRYNSSGRTRIRS